LTLIVVAFAIVGPRNRSLAWRQRSRRSLKVKKADDAERSELTLVTRKHDAPRALAKLLNNKGIASKEGG
jgi:hypothetical protein